MASAPHDKTGKTCARCSKPFTKSSMTLTITTKQGNYQVAEAVCSDCHHTHYEQGE